MTDDSAPGKNLLELSSIHPSDALVTMTVSPYSKEFSNTMITVCSRSPSSVRILEDGGSFPTRALRCPLELTNDVGHNVSSQSQNVTVCLPVLFPCV